MNTHEFQAKEILKRYDIPIPEFVVVTKVEEVDKAIKQLDTTTAVIKIQVHAGGRGKAGGVKFAKTPRRDRASRQAADRHENGQQSDGP